MWRAWKRAARLTIAGCMLAAAIAEPAIAGTYTVYGCSLPDGSPAPVDGWTFDGSPDGLGRWSNTCQSVNWADRSLSAWLHPGANIYDPTLVGPPATTDSRADLTFTAPADTVITEYMLYRHEHAQGQYINGTYRDLLWYDDAGGVRPVDRCSTRDGCYERGTAIPSQRLSALNRIYRGGVALRWLTASAQCTSDVGGKVSCDGDLERAVAVYAAWMTLRDLVPPVITAKPAGGLLDPTVPVEGLRVVRLTAEDRGGGLARATLLVDGVPLLSSAPDSFVATCADPYVAVVPCPLRSSFTLEADTRSVSNGPHRFEVAVTDVGGNTTLSAPVTVTVQNDGAPNGVGATRLAGLTARFHGAKSSAPLRRTVGFGQPAWLQGRLADPSGRPIANARLDVAFRIDRPGSGWREQAGVVTNASGGWRVDVPRGASRQVKVSYRAFALDDTASVEILGTVHVRAGVRLAVRPRRVGPHGRIVFTGRLLGGPGRASTQVALYAVAARGRTRVPVAVLHADQRGQFRYAYRFTRTLAPTTYWFQVFVDAQRGYPYAAWRSRRVVVRVT